MGERGEETTNVFAAAQESTAIGGEEEMLLMVPERDTPGHKRSAPDYGQLDEQELANMKRRKKNPNPPPPKKLNNEQWDLMFERLVEYKRQHGVSSFCAVSPDTSFCFIVTAVALLVENSHFIHQN